MGAHRETGLPGEAAASGRVALTVLGERKYLGSVSRELAQHGHRIDLKQCRAVRCSRRRALWSAPVLSAQGEIRQGAGLGAAGSEGAGHALSVPSRALARAPGRH